MLGVLGYVGEWYVGNERETRVSIIDLEVRVIRGSNIQYHCFETCAVSRLLINGVAVSCISHALFTRHHAVRSGLESTCLQQAHARTLMSIYFTMPHESTFERRQVVGLVGAQDAESSRTRWAPQPLTCTAFEWLCNEVWR